MTDRLTQLQESLDQLLTQMYATVHYIDTRHPYASIPGQSDQNPFRANPDNPQQSAALSQPAPGEHNTSQNALDPPPQSIPQTQAASQAAEHGEQDPNGPPRPASPRTFHATLKELAQDLVLKEMQIEILIDALPGLGNSQEEQEKRIEELEAELREVEAQRKDAAKEREDLLERVEGRILGARRL